MSSQLAARPAVSARICHVPPSVGSAGGRISFRTCTNLGARRDTCDALVLDEAHVLTTAAHGSLLPTLSARRRAQVWFAGTAVDQQVNEDGVALSAVRERAVKGDSEAATLAYFEWSAGGRLEDATEATMCDPQA